MKIAVRLKKESRPLARLWRAQGGLTTLEFAIVSPVLMLMVMGIAEMGLAMFAQSVLEGATFSASRLGKTGYSAAASTREETIRNILSERAGVLLDVNKVSMTSQTYQQFDQIGDPEPFIDANGNGDRDEGENYTDVNGNGVYDTDMGASGLGNAGEVVVYTVSYPWRIITPLMAQFFGANGVLNLSARTVVQNEPY